MELSFNRENLEIQTRSGVRRFYLQEHTNEEFDEYLEKSSIVLDRAIAKLRDMSKEFSSGNHVDPEELHLLKKAVAESSSSLVAELLHPDDQPNPLPPVTAEWVRGNLSWRMRESIINKQNELDGVETVKDQSFLVETALVKNYLSIKIELNRIKLDPSQVIRSQSMTDSENLPGLVIETPEQSEHVSIEELEIDEDGFVQA